MEQSREQDIIDAIHRTNARIRDLQQQKEFINKLINTNEGTRAKLQFELNSIRYSQN